MTKDTKLTNNTGRGRGNLSQAAGRRMTAVAMAMALAAATGAAIGQTTDPETAMLSEAAMLDNIVAPHAAGAIGAIGAAITQAQVQRALDADATPPTTAAARSETGLGPITLWAQGYGQAYDFTHEGAEETEFEGEVTSGLAGIDSMFLGGGLLLGIAVGETQADFEFTQDESLEKQNHKLSLTGFRPYFGYRGDDGFRLWGALGVDEGEVETSRDARVGDAARDAEMTSLSLGAYFPLYQAGGVGRGLNRVGFVGDLTRSELEINLDASGNEAADHQAARMRLGLEFHHNRVSARGTFAATMDLTFRRDADDGLTGNGFEIGGNLGWRLFGSGVSLDIGGRALLAHSDRAIREQSVNGNVAWSSSDNPLGGGEGLSIAFSPQWGTVAGRSDNAWREDTTAFAADNGAGYQLEIKYGLALTREAELLTLFARDRHQRGQDSHGGRQTNAGADYQLGDHITAGYEFALWPGGDVAADHRGYIRYRRGF